MKYLLDTNAIIALISRRNRMDRRIRNQSPNAFGLSVIVLHELYFGAFKGRRTNETLARMTGLGLELVAFNSDDARCAAEARALLATAGTPAGPYDILIAGQALARDLTLITHNTREFSRVAGLRIEDWEA